MTHGVPRRVLNTLAAQSNEAQDEWTSEFVLLTVTCANGGLEPDAVLTALETLQERGQVEQNGDGEYRVVENVERIKHPGEL